MKSGCRKVYFTILILTLVSFNGIKAQHTSIKVDTLITLIDGHYAPFNALMPGDTILLQPGLRPYLLFRNIQGAPELPVIIMNDKGLVRINSNHYFGISVQKSRYFKITGTGDPAIFYGFKIERVMNGAGIGIGAGSSDFEIDHISISNTSIAGIYAKTDPDCELNFTRDKFTQFNTVIHDTYIENSGNEGMYIGNTKYFGQSVTCGETDTLLLPSLLSGVRIFNNIIKNPGWDGIQVSSASTDCSVFNNVVTGDSWAEQFNQMSGIIIGGGSKCDCYNNYIANGKGNGIESHGIGDYKIFNNIIVNAGKEYNPGDYQQMKYGIFLTDVSTVPGSSYALVHNNIINPKSDGIRFLSTLSNANLIASNLIVNPGNFDFYQNGGTSFHGEDSYIMIPDLSIDALLTNNFLTRNINDAGIDTVNFTIMNNSPLTDSGYHAAGVLFDHYNKPRPYGAGYDIGAFEFNPQYLGLENMPEQPEIKLYPNPANDNVFISVRSEGTVEKITIKIYSIEGRLVMHQTENLAHDLNPIFFNVKFLKSGLYFCAICGTNWNKTGKLIIGH